MLANRASKTAVRNFLHVTFTLGKSPFSTRRKEWNRLLCLFCVSSRSLESKLWKVLDIEGWGSLMWEFHCLKCVTLQRRNTITLVCSTSGGGSATKVPVLTGIAWKKKTSRKGKKRLGRGYNYNSWYIEKLMQSGQVSQAFDGVMAATQLAWHKRLLSQPLILILSAQDTVRCI